MQDRKIRTSPNAFFLLDEDANKFYDRKHDFYQTALLNRCYTQNALPPYIDSEINHIRYLIILKIKNRLLFVIDIINLLEVKYSISINWLLISVLLFLKVQM